MAKRLDWDRVNWENLIAARGSETIQATPKESRQPCLDNFHQTRRVVLTFNYENRRDRYKLGVYRQIYNETLKECNICPYCRRPIKTRPFVRGSGVSLTKVFPRPKFYAVVRCHFEIRVAPERGKYYFVYVDGTGRDIRSRNEPNSKLRYLVVVHPDGTEERIREWFTTYTVYDEKCRC